MQLSKKLKRFSQFFTAFINSSFNFEHFGIKDEPHSLCISEFFWKKVERDSWCISDIIDSKRRAYLNL